MKYQVKLIRGPADGQDRTWPHVSEAGARKRADALADLHSVPSLLRYVYLEQADDGEPVTVYVVDASDFYTEDGCD